jgi:endoribonuclease L-PSP, putative
MINIIETSNAPSAIGPYSQAIMLDNLIFTSGQLGIDLKTGNLVEGGVEIQTKQAIQNLSAILESAGSSLKYVLKTTLFIANMDDFAIINKIYAEYFTDHKPARSCIQAGRLPKDALFEIEAIAVKA